MPETKSKIKINVKQGAVEISSVFVFELHADVFMCVIDTPKKGMAYDILYTEDSAVCVAIRRRPLMKGKAAPTLVTVENLPAGSFCTLRKDKYGCTVIWSAMPSCEKHLVSQWFMSVHGKPATWSKDG